MDYRVNGTVLGFPLDDSWIHMTFGRNLAYGLGFGINPGESSGASTSPLWSIWLGLIHWIVGGLGLRSVIFAVKISGVILTCLLIFGLVRILELFSASRHIILGGGIFVIFSYPWAWAALSGMEIPLTAAICVWALYFQLNGCSDSRFFFQRRVSVLLWVLAAVARPENMILLSGMLLIAAEKEDGGYLKGLIRLVSWAAPLIVLYTAFYYYLTGFPLPSTFQAKMTERALPRLIQSAGLVDGASIVFRSAQKDLADTFFFASGENVLNAVLWFFVPFLIRQGEVFHLSFASGSIRRVFYFCWALPAIFALMVGLIAGPEHYTIFHGRYLAPNLCLASLATAIAAGLAWEKFKKSMIAIVPLIFAFILVCGRQVELGWLYALENQNINQLQVKLARWLGERWSPNLTLGVNDIGAIGYFGRQKIIDLEGLITPEAIPFKRMGKTDEFVSKVQPDLLVIFPYWYPEIVGKPEKFHPILKHSIEKNLTGGGEEMVFFMMPWSRNLPKIFPSPEKILFPEKVPVPPLHLH